MFKKLSALFFISIILFTCVQAEAGPLRRLLGGGQGGGQRAAEDKGAAEQGKPLTNIKNTPGNYEKIADVAYGNDIMQKMDIYVPNNSQGLKPLMIYVH